jgi:hypothetical protein
MPTNDFIHPWSSGNLSLGYDCFPVPLIRDVVTNILPGKNREGIESLLGPSRSHEDMRRHSDADFEVRERDEQGNWKPFPRSGVGHYFDEHEWDLIYVIGREQILMFDHKGQEFSPDREDFMVRLDAEGKFESWFIEGSTRWPSVVGHPGSNSFRPSRN